MPRKTSKQGMSLLREELGGILLALRPYVDMFDHDLGDAIAACTGLLYHRNKPDALGNSEEGLIFIPD